MNNSYRKNQPAALAVAPLLLDPEEITSPFSLVETTIRPPPRPTMPGIVDAETERLSRRSIHEDDDDLISSGFPTPPSRSGLTAIVRRPPMLESSEIPTLIPPPLPPKESVPIILEELLAMTLPPPPRMPAHRPVAYVPAARPTAYSASVASSASLRTTPASRTSHATIALMLLASVVFTSIAITLLVSAAGQVKLCIVDR